MTIAPVNQNNQYPPTGLPRRLYDWLVRLVENIYSHIGTTNQLVAESHARGHNMDDPIDHLGTNIKVNTLQEKTSGGVLLKDVKGFGHSSGKRVMLSEETGASIGAAAEQMTSAGTIPGLIIHQGRLFALTQELVNGAQLFGFEQPLSHVIMDGDFWKADFFDGLPPIWDTADKGAHTWSLVASNPRLKVVTVNAAKGYLSQIISTLPWEDYYAQALVMASGIGEGGKVFLEIYDDTLGDVVASSELEVNSGALVMLQCYFVGNSLDYTTPATMHVRIGVEGETGITAYFTNVDCHRLRARMLLPELL